MMQTHLRKYAEDGIQQKVRLSNLYEDYNYQENKTRERIIDQTGLVDKLTQNNEPQERIDLVQERLDNDEMVLENVQKHLSKTYEEVSHLTEDLSTHVKELSEIEIQSGGFITHPIGVDKGATLDKNNMSITFEENGHIEIPIGTYLSSWRDSSQLTIRPVKKGGE